MIDRNRNGWFTKGVSGNPGGRPRVDKTVREIAQAHTKETIETLFKIANNPKTTATVRV